jgi:ketosteroid isomerase-like protein
MRNNQELIIQFYTALQNMDYKTMQDCYHDDAIFFDPVFQDLNAYEVRNMWEMLCKSAKGFSLTFSDIEANDEYGSCKWKATYHISGKNKKVNNSIKAYFKFHEGKILEHTDDFDLWKWSRQALGISGWILGWSEFLQQQIRVSAQDKLLEFLNKKISSEANAIK